MELESGAVTQRVAKPEVGNILKGLPVRNWPARACRSHERRRVYKRRFPS